MSNNLLLASVIIPAYNAESTIGLCLQALDVQTVPRHFYEIIVVDDGSTDLTRHLVELIPAVRLLVQKNAGPAVARNLGAQHARGQILLFTDADCMPQPDWIERMVAPFSQGDIAGVKGAYITTQAGLIARFVQQEYEDKYDHMLKNRYIDFIDTYSAGYRRDIFISNHGFSAAFPTASVEDQEFSFRLARQGYKMLFVPKALVCHLGHADSLMGYWSKKYKIGYWKPLVHLWHPRKMLEDAHTPQILKLQMLLGLIICSSGLGIIYWPAGGIRLSGLLSLLFLLSILPFLSKSWKKDPWVALISPVLLFERSLALGMGFAIGTIHHVWTMTKSVFRKRMGGLSQGSNGAGGLK